MKNKTERREMERGVEKNCFVFRFHDVLRRDIFRWKLAGKLSRSTA